MGGIALIVVGVWALLVATGIISAAMLDLLGRSIGALAIIGLGVAVLVATRRTTSFTWPARGTRLYRSRSDRWIGGVIGGLGAYFGVDPVALRIVTILLTLVGLGSLVVAYIVMWIVVPEEPLVPNAAAAAPAPASWPAPPPPPPPPAPTEPPVPPVPPAPYEPPAPSADGS
jgi:phage shock protein PspC (stress-responsive transcriptional regulator)